MLCNETEKHALLSFKHSLFDPSNRLASWSDQEDCCSWNGVHCHNITGQVLQLHLRNPCFLDPEISCDEFILGGKVSAALLQLESLNYLNLKLNDFGGTPIPRFLGSMQSLTFLDLSFASFGGLIPPQLGNLSNLRYLGLGGGGYVENLSWITHLSSLESLNMDTVDLNKEVHWLELTSMLSFLSILRLDFCELDNMGDPSLGYVNFTSLTVLSLSENNFNHELPNWLFNLTGSTNLLQLDLSHNSLKGRLPESLGQLKHLEFLSLEDNSFDGPIPSSLGNLSSLGSLSLSRNRLNGTLPSSMWVLSDLEFLDIGRNPLADTISEEHLNKLSKLEYLDMSSESLTFKVKSNWVPPFQLIYLLLSSCRLGPNFPTWLQTQTYIAYLDISKSGIMDIAPKWFWKWASHIDVQIDLSDNQISGNLSGVLLNNTYIDISSNHFTGELPQLSPRVLKLKMSNNSFFGPISSLLCQKFNGKRNILQTLDISINSISGELSHCLMYWQSITHLDLGNNQLSGKVPDFLGTLFELEVLHLNNNSFYGDIPPSLQNCTSLGLLDLRGNKFSGNIPVWIKEMTTLMVLSLRSNELIGNIPPQICQLSSLIILDFANNSLSGTIPNCFNNFSSMATISTKDDAFTVLDYYSGGVNYENLQLVIKGEEWEYKGILKLVRTIDLSSNGFWGSIPSQITNLSGLQSLNLSFNQLTGSVPERIGNMKALESLDLSRNHLSGEIPQSMGGLTFLNHLDFSYNNFSGKIPSSTQLRSFKAVSYIGNDGLCGAPLTKICPEDEEESDKGKHAIQENEEEDEMPWFFYIGMGVGFVMGFGGVCSVLIFKKAWRFSYFQFISDVKNWMYVVIAVSWNRLQNNFRVSPMHHRLFVSNNIVFI